jgi:uncharacterized protein (DUF1684 family)
MATYVKSIQDFRENRDQKTKADPLHWLNLAGLFWLEEGENSFGKDASNRISLSGLPHGFCGVIKLSQGVVTFHPTQDLIFTCNNSHPETRPLFTESDPEPDLINIDSITIKIIVRGESTLVRAWDRESAAGGSFNGFHYYPVREEYRIKAKYIRHATPITIKRLDMIGTGIQSEFPGSAHFKLNGADCILEAENSEGKLLFHFTDSTCNVTTYGGGRKFLVPIPEGDEIILDFNLAQNWPCAYTHFATCPLVPQENRLTIKIEAGEKKYFE